LNPAVVEAFSLKGRVAVVTGASSGIGRQTAIRLAQAGGTVILGDIDKVGLAATAETVGESNGGAITQATDVSSRQSVQSLADVAMAVTGQIDVWVNSAGILQVAPITSIDETALDDVLRVNLKGVVWGSQAAATAMSRAGRGSIINIASGGGEVAAPNISIYAMSKAAVIMFTRSLACEHGSDGVRANAIAPGFIDTPLTAYSYTGKDGVIDEEAREQVLASRSKTSPLGIVGQADDIALAALYLASDASQYVTGQTLRVNGGSYML
jgi:3-oxoacyl-[acyl-carrier protein] reductase